MRLPPPARRWADAAIDVLTDTLGPFFDVIRAVFAGSTTPSTGCSPTPPFWVVILVLAALACCAKGWKLALGTGRRASP